MDYSLQDLASFAQKAKLVFPQKLTKAEISPTKKLTGKEFFSLLGYQEYLTVDVSDYEGAEIIHDLNQAGLDPSFHGVADLVIDCGTMEHVFHVPNALNTIHQLVKIGGVVFHHNPSNGYLDHGFYQFCPTFYYDYYKGNNYRILSANLVDRKIGVKVKPYYTDIYRKIGKFEGVKAYPRTTMFFCAQKTEGSSSDIWPIQTFYREMHADFSQQYENAFPYDFQVSTLREKLSYRFPVLFSLAKRMLNR